MLVRLHEEGHAARMPGARVSFAEQQAAAKRALNPQVRADALRLVTERNERQAQRAPLLFSLTIGAATAAQHCCCCWRPRLFWEKCDGAAT
ncbi:MAG: hypothetical protein WA837_15850 [Xanthobacteraceae bacterium]